MTLATFMADERTADAVERCLARISEAAAKLGDKAETLCPGIPWRDVRGLGNRLRHDCAGIDRVRLWLLAENDLASLKAACQDGLRRLGDIGLAALGHDAERRGRTGLQLSRCQGSRSLLDGKSMPWGCRSKAAAALLVGNGFVQLCPWRVPPPFLACCRDSVTS